MAVPAPPAWLMPHLHTSPSIKPGLEAGEGMKIELQNPPHPGALGK